MNRGAFQNACWTGVAVFGVCCFLGCEPAPPANNDDHSRPESPSTITAEDVKREASEAASAAKEYLSQKSAEFAASMDVRLQELDAQLAEMKVEADKLSGQAKEKWEAARQDLKVKRDEMKVKLEELKNSSGDAWKEMKAGLEKAGDDLDHAIEGAKEKLRSDKAESPEPNETEPPQAGSTPQKEPAP